MEILARESSPGSLRRKVTLIVALYALASVGWIALSDRLVGVLVRDPDLLVRISVIKGLGFVGVTSALLYGLLRWALIAVERERGFADSLIEAMPGMLYLYTESGTFKRWNRNFERVSGRSADEIARMHPSDFFAPAERALLEKRIAETFETGESSLEASLISKDGGAHPTFFTGRRVTFERQTCLVGVGVDITLRKQAEDELRKSEERLRSTLDSILEACQLIDFDWRYLYLNGAAAQQNRRPNAELLGQRFSDAWPGVEATPVFGLMQQCMTERRSAHEEVEFSFPDGARGWFDVRVQPVPEGIFVLSVDITERRKAEHALRDLNSSLERKVEERTYELEAAKVRAEAADRTKSAFLATMSHELRTPLNSIIGFTGIVLQGLAGPLTAEQSKQLGMVKGSARHLLELINDVLDISRIEAGQLEVRRAPFDLEASVERVAASVAPFAARKGLELKVTVAPTPIESDQRRVEQILLNVVNNAIKFTEGGSVSVSIEHVSTAQPPVVRVHVTDTGMGIRKEDLDQLFQPFRQVDSGLQRHHEGTGLGLAISRRLSGLLGGSIDAESVPGQGSRFTLTLPLQWKANR